MSDQPRKRRSPWLKSQSDGFKPIKQVGVAIAIGFPLLAMGALVLIAAIGSGTTLLWWLGGGLCVVGAIAAVSGAIT